MVHTSLYNDNLKQSDKITFEKFVTMNKEIMKDEGLPEEIMEEIYKGLEEKEIKMDERSSRITKMCWRYLQKKSKKKNAQVYRYNRNTWTTFE